MQTFLPYMNFVETAQCLDKVRLLNQRNEAQIICAHIFPMRASFACKKCWDKGGIPLCTNCGKQYRACKCTTCKDKGIIPSCPSCGRIPGPIKEMTGWRFHPAVLMWRPYRWALLAYAFEICRECKRRGFEDTVYEKLKTYGFESSFADLDKRSRPFWLGDTAFHNSHRSNLLRKDPVWYGQFDWNVGKDLPYVWPRA